VAPELLVNRRFRAPRLRGDVNVTTMW
jgi:hypothetical protein